MLLLAAAPARSAVTDAPFGQSPAQRIASLAAIPGGFQDTLAFSGLTMPDAIRFAPDGTTVVPMNAPWRFDEFDGWVVVEEGSTAPILTT